MLKLLKNKINQYLDAKREKRQYAKFLSYTNTELKDAINNIPRPEKNVLRILCTSDALNKQLKELDDNADYMVVNSFVSHEAYAKLRPKYYVLADPNFFNLLSHIVDKIYDDTKWPLTLFVPWAETNQKQLSLLNDCITLKQVNANAYVGPEQYRIDSYEHNLAMPMVYNVLNMALYIAIYLGYDRVELYGAEHSWTRLIYVGEDNRLYWKDSHFYDKEPVPDTALKHADGSNIKMHEIMYEYYRVFKCYWELRELANRHHCHIVNMTPNSFIDAFEKGTNNK